MSVQYTRGKKCPQPGREADREHRKVEGGSPDRPWEYRGAAERVLGRSKRYSRPVAAKKPASSLWGARYQRRGETPEARRLGSKLIPG